MTPVDRMLFDAVLRDVQQHTPELAKAYVERMYGELTRMCEAFKEDNGRDIDPLECYDLNVTVTLPYTQIVMALSIVSSFLSVMEAGRAVGVDWSSFDAGANAEEVS